MKVSVENLRMLKEVQDLDLEIIRIRKERDALPPEISALNRRTESLSRDIAEISEEMKSLSRERRKSESVLDDRLAELDRLRSQKNLVSSNEAYSALLKEIEGVEAERDRAEEDILMHMERLEELSKLSEKKEKELSGLKKDLESLNKKNEARVRKLDELLSELLERRGRKTCGIGDDILPAYERARQERGGLALVRAVNNACAGCSLELRPQVMSELMRGEILFCESCSRLIYRDGENG